ncbi:hypothetical protein ACET3Z_027504 [Daucus carota]
MLRFISKIKVAAMLMLLLALVQQSQCNESFKDCYIKCYVFCMIEPSQTLCTCTTRCFKNCILPSIYSSTATTQSRRRSDDLAHQHSQNIAFCKLGCASTSCSALSTISNPNGENVESCVGSCSNKCIKTYPSASSSP